MSNKNALVIMLKNPVIGKVKTRLAKDAGNEAALEIYKKLLEHTQNITSTVQVDKFIFYSDLIERKDNFDNASYRKYVQCSGDLGSRMDYGFSIPFKNEYKDVVMIGADCYELTTADIENAFEGLRSTDFVIGPAKDGGYYLIGMKKWNRWILQNKSWSTDQLLNETLADIQSKNATITTLRTLSDIDNINDLANFPELKALL